MKLFWNIRFLDRTARVLDGRRLFLDTDNLPRAERIALELVLERESLRDQREILRFRHFFRQQQHSDLSEDASAARTKFFSLANYFEDESGGEIREHELWGFEKPLEGPHADVLPPIPVAEVTLSHDEIRLLAIFLRDHKEPATSSLMKEGPGSLTVFCDKKLANQFEI